MSDVIEYRICKHGHVQSPSNLTKRGTCNICNTIYIQRHRSKTIIKNPSKYKEQSAKYRKANKEYVNASQRKTRKKQVQTITECYVSEKLGIKLSQLTPELYELVKERLLIFRAIKELNQTIKEIGGIND
jgi:hypothetical protein